MDENKTQKWIDENIAPIVKAGVEADRARPDASARHPDIHDNNSVQVGVAVHAGDASKMVPSDAEIVAHLRSIGIVQENLVVSKYEMSIARAVLDRWGQPAASARTDKMVWCACGDGYPADSYGAGFIDAAGHCEDCDAAEHAVQEAASGEPVDNLGVPLSCGKPLCSPGNHHPLCNLAATTVAQEPVNLEHCRAIKESERNAAENEFFNARPKLNDTPYRVLFCAGFDRGWDAAPVAAQPSVPESVICVLNKLWEAIQGMEHMPGWQDVARARADLGLAPAPKEDQS